MFANLDYPESDEHVHGHRGVARRRQVLDRLAGRPSTGGRCAAAARWPSRWRCWGSIPGWPTGRSTASCCPRLVAEAERRGALRALHAMGRGPPVSHRPGGGQLLRRRCLSAPARGRTPRRGEVRRRVPGLCQPPRSEAPGTGDAAEPVRTTGGSGVPRDVGADWDFDGRARSLSGGAVRRRCRVSLREADADRYLELSRAVSGEVMAEVLGEWRRAGVAVPGRAGAMAARPDAGGGLGGARSTVAEPKVGVRPPEARAGAGGGVEHR